MMSDTAKLRDLEATARGFLANVAIEPRALVAFLKVAAVRAGEAASLIEAQAAEVVRANNIERLALAQVKETTAILEAQAARIKALEEREQALVAGLKPFAPTADVLRAIAGLHDSLRLFCTSSASVDGWDIGPLSVGDLRRAACLLPST